MKSNKIGLVIMASGLGKRFGGNKLVEVLGDKPLVQWIIDTTDGIFDRRIVVTRSNEVKELCDKLMIDCIYHRLPNRNDTIRLGLSYLMNDVDYCFFTPGDQPLIKKESIAALVEKARVTDAMIYRTRFGDRVGSPVGFHRCFYEDLLSLPEGKGGSLVVKNNLSATQAILVACDYELWDVDTAEDLDNIRMLINGLDT